jgi:hypothetical protein
MEIAGDKLFFVPHVAPVGHSLLLAVGAWPPRTFPRENHRRCSCSTSSVALLDFIGESCSN